MISVLGRRSRTGLSQADNTAAVRVPTASMYRLQRVKKALPFLNLGVLIYFCETSGAVRGVRGFRGGFWLSRRTTDALQCGGRDQVVTEFSLNFGLLLVVYSAGGIPRPVVWSHFGEGIR